MVDERRGVSERTGGKFGGFLLPALLMVGAAGGFVFGGHFGHLWTAGEPGFWIALITLAGEVFLNVLKMVVVPLIVCSMIAGVASLGDIRKIGGTAGYTLAYYALTTFAAVLLGLILVNVIQPGRGARERERGDIRAEAPALGGTESDLADTQEASGKKDTAANEAEAAKTSPIPEKKSNWYEPFFGVIRTMTPPNLFAAAAEDNVLGLIVFSLLFGGILTTLGEQGRRVVEFFETVNNALLRFVQIVIWLAPIGVFGLVAAKIGQEGGWDAVARELETLARYSATVLIGLGVHGFLVLPVILWFLTRRKPFRYLIQCAEALLTAFSTASSAATLPVTMRCTREKAGVGEEAAGFVLPVGATINMDGTALYEAVAVMFIAQAYGRGLSVGEQMIVLLTATLAAIGAAAIPQAGLFTMVIVLRAVHLPLEGIALLISIDWLLDRFRTAVNVWGDCVGASAVDARLGRNSAENPVNTG